MNSPVLVSQRCDVLREGLVELESSAFLIERWAVNLMDAVARGGKILVAGNGGSAALAAHFTRELLGRYARGRPPLPAGWARAPPAPPPPPPHTPPKPPGFAPPPPPP